MDFREKVDSFLYVVDLVVIDSSKKARAKTIMEQVARAIVQFESLNHNSSKTIYTRNVSLAMHMVYELVYIYIYIIDLHRLSGQVFYYI